MTVWVNLRPWESVSEYNWRLTNRKIQQCKDIFRQLIAKPELLVESIFGVLYFEACKGKKESKKDFLPFAEDLS